MDTATVSVLVSGAVGLGGLSAPFLMEKRAGARRQREARDSRLDELRSVIDDAVVALIAIQDAVPHEDHRIDEQEVRNALPPLSAALTRAWQQEARLAARLGANSLLVERYREASVAWRTVAAYWRDILGGDAPKVSWADADEALTSAIKRFFEASSDMVGPDRG